MFLVQMPELLPKITALFAISLLSENLPSPEALWRVPQLWPTVQCLYEVSVVTRGFAAAGLLIGWVMNRRVAWAPVRRRSAVTAPL